MQRVPVAVLVSFCACAVPLWGVEEPESSESSKASRPAPPPDQLRLEVVITRFDGERLLGRAPYTLLIPSDRSKRADIKMGVEVPVAVRTGSGDSETVEFQYRNVGTNIQCAAQEVTAGLYQVGLHVETSSVYTGSRGRPGGADIAGKPIFNSFRANLDPLLRDGDSVEIVTSTDPVTGHVVKIGVSLKVEWEAE